MSYLEGFLRRRAEKGLGLGRPGGRPTLGGCCADSGWSDSGPGQGGSAGTRRSGWISRLARALQRASEEEGFCHEVRGAASPGPEIQDRGGVGGLDSATDSSPLLSHVTGRETEAQSQSNFRTQLAELGFELVMEAAQAHCLPFSGLPYELADLGRGSGWQPAPTAVSLWVEARAAVRKREVRPQKRCRKFSCTAATPPRPLKIWKLQEKADGGTPRPSPWVLQLRAPILKVL